MLTGLLNRDATSDALQALLIAGDVSLVRFDVNGFIRVNHDLGHSAGDIVLRRIATVVAAHASAGDLLGRIGSDDFVVARVGAHERDLADMGRRVVEEFRERVPIEVVSLGQSVVAAEVEVILTAVLVSEGRNGEASALLARATEESESENVASSVSGVATIDEEWHRRLSSLPAHQRLGLNSRYRPPSG